MSEYTPGRSDDFPDVRYEESCRSKVVGEGRLLAHHGRTEIDYKVAKSQVLLIGNHDSYVRFRGTSLTFASLACKPLRALQVHVHALVMFSIRIANYPASTSSPQ